MKNLLVHVLLAGVLLAVVLVPALSAHHILGIPHYAYDEDYPQAPVITYRIEAGPYLLNLTGYPGKPVPDELCQMKVYVRRTADESDVFAGPLQVEIYRQELLGEERIYGPVETRFTDNVHEFSLVYDAEGRYRVRLEMMLEGEPYEVDFPMVVGDPGRPWMPLVLWGGAAALLLAVVRAVKIKVRRAALRTA